jgi:REP element-mobilizing transposase RayT
MDSKSTRESYHAQNLPHIRSAGRTYHVRFSIAIPSLALREDWAFALTEEAILFRHKWQSIVYGYIIMPNHVHTILQPLPLRSGPMMPAGIRDYHALEAIVAGIKKHTALEINSRLGRTGPFWQEESFDRIIRSGKDLEGTIEYIHRNPVRWGLASRAEEYRWSSINTIYSGRIEYADWFDLSGIIG